MNILRKIVLLVSTLFTFAVPVDAKVLVVRNTNITADETIVDNYGSLRRIDDVVIAALDYLGVDYVVIPKSAARTLWCRTGTQVWGNGSTEQFDAVIHLGWSRNVSTFGFRPYYPDSMTKGGQYPLVPQAFFGTDLVMHEGGSACSTGVAGTGPNGSTITGGVVYNVVGGTLPWRSGHQSGFEVSGNYPAGGFRPLVSANMSGYSKYNRITGTSLPCVDCDSTSFSADTVVMWEIPWSNEADNGAKPIVFCAPHHLAAYSHDPGLVLMAIARLDSLTGGAVIGSKHPEVVPRKIGIQIRGGWQRDGRARMGGISPDDTTALKASIDSLASLGVPFVVGVNTDSLDKYTRDKTWWMQASPWVHFTPEINIDSVGTGKGNASWQLPFDPFGAYRNRIMVGDDSGAGADTSVKTLLRANLWKMDSTFGRGLVDRMLIPPKDDWSPKSMGTQAAGPGWDSLYAAILASGAKGVVSNPVGTNGRGTSRTGKAPNMQGTIKGMKILATPGYLDSASARIDAGEYGDAYGPKQALNQVNKFLDAMIGARRVVDGGGTWYSGLGDSSIVRASIYTIHASDLGSGVGTNWATRPTRPGWWQIKPVVNEIKAINYFAGRTVIKVDYPENIEP